MKKIKVIVMDMDGTLLNSEKKISIRTMQALKKMHSYGYRIGLASGRPLIGLERTANDLAIKDIVDFMVAFNGAEMYDSADDITEKFYQLEPEIIADIIEEYKEFGLNPYVYQGDVCYAYHNDSTIQRAANNNHLTVKICDMLSEIKSPQSKLVLSTPAEKMSEVEAYYELHKSDRFRAFKTQADMFEFVHPKLSKVYGIKAYCEKYGLSLGQVAAFGDTTNDIEMIAECGMGVCMCNGTQDAKDVADIVTEYSNDEDGLAMVLEAVMRGEY